MTIVISEFNINCLHGYRTIKVPVKDNKIVLVGENGTGKSTVANLIYYFLTCQWNKVAEYDLQKISAIINDEEIIVTKEQIDSNFSSKTRNDFLQKYSRDIWIRLEDSLSRDFSRFGKDQILERLYNDKFFSITSTGKLGIPLSIIEEFMKIKFGDNFHFHLDESLKEISLKIKNFIDFQVLYLPTYRRIEQDLKSILPGIDLDRQLLREREYNRRRPSNYIEIIEFGMEDVEITINSKMEKLKDSFRTELNNLTGTYLRDVIRETYKNVEIDKLQGLENFTIESIFSRIDEKTLPERDQQRLRNFILEIQNEDNITSIENERKVLAYFILKLIELQKAQDSKEQDVRDFIKVCNKYLVGKEIVYNNIDFKITISSKGEDIKDELKMQMLSSGEKQIVSLFSHIYLSGINGYFIIIDEPELSLSVPWQKNFLPDIIDNSRCNGLVAVTHSPFIFQNNTLNDYTHNLEEFIE